MVAVETFKARDRSTLAGAKTSLNLPPPTQKSDCGIELLLGASSALTPFPLLRSSPPLIACLLAQCN